MHKENDLDSSPFAYHHSLGTKAGQAAAGNHKHGDLDSRITVLEALLKLEVSLSSTASSGAISTVETILLTVPSVDYDGLTEVELMYSYYNFVKTVATDTFFIRFYDGATLLQQHLIEQTANLNGGGRVHRTRFTPSAGTHNAMTVKMIRNTGTGTGSISAAAGSPQIISARAILA